jgi:hypothetical protein
MAVYQDKHPGSSHKRPNQQGLSANQNLWLVSLLASAHNTSGIAAARPGIRAAAKQKRQ